MKKRQHIKDTKPAKKEIFPAARVEAPVIFAPGHIPKVLAVIVILAIGMLIYANSLHNEFVFDDKEHVVQNTAIRSLKNIPGIFTHNLTYFGGQEEGKFYRPVETLTFMINYALHGLDPFGYHVVNTALHILVCLLLFYLLSHVIGDTVIALIVSMVYLVHPVHTEAVAYISGRADSISSIFLILMVVFQYKSWSCNGFKRALYYAVILLCFMLALLTKESAVVFPFLLMFFEYCMRKKDGYLNLIGKGILFYLPFFAIIGVWLFFKNKFVSTETMVIIQTSMVTRLAALPRVIANYLRISFLPVNLHMEYRYPFTETIFKAGYFVPFVFVAGLLPFIWHIWKRGLSDINFRIMSFGLGWFLIALLPYLNIFFQLNAIFSEHWLYIPGMGLALFVVYGAFYLTRGIVKAQALAALLFVCAIAIFSFATVRQNDVWKDNTAFFEYTIKHAPYSAKAYNNLAVEYIKKQNFEDAMGLLEKAVELDPNYETASENLEKLKVQLSKE